MSPQLVHAQGVRVAIEGCGHGTLDAIYASIAESCARRGWDGVDLVLIGGDFQAVRNAADLSVMSCPPKYRALGDFPYYYRGDRAAPYLTLFIGGNHEASSHLWELFHGGWVAPNIYYLGAAGVVRFGPLRIAGLSGIWKGFDYNRTHHERLPFSQDDVRSFYHVREIDVRRLLLLRTQVDIGMSHDWPRYVERHGDEDRLFAIKKDFRRDSYDGTLGSPAAAYVMDRLRPRYWYSAHLHCRFAAIKKYPPPAKPGPAAAAAAAAAVVVTLPPRAPEPAAPVHPIGNPDEIDLDLDDGEAPPAQPLVGNPDEIDLDLDDTPHPTNATPTTGVPRPVGNPDEIDLGLDDGVPPANATPALAAAGAPPKVPEPAAPAQPLGNPDEIDLDLDDEGPPAHATPTSTSTSLETGRGSAPHDVRAQLPASFAKPAPRPTERKKTPGQPVPPGITNQEVRFLALDKCLPGRHFLQLIEIDPHPTTTSSSPAEPRTSPSADPASQHSEPRPSFTLQYDAEWLAITRVFSGLIAIGDPSATNPEDLGESHYNPLIDAELAWVEENVVARGRMEVPRNFEVTAPPHVDGTPETVDEMPVEYTNPQTAAFCEMLGVPNLWAGSEEEREARRAKGPAEGQRRGGWGGGRGGGRGGRGGRESGHRGRGRQRGGGWRGSRGGQH